MGKDSNFQAFLDSIVQQKYKLDHTPVQLSIGLTNACNLHCAFCPYCGFCEAKTEMVHMMPLKLLEQLKPYLFNAAFTAPSGRGEPFLYKEFDKFLDICRECDALCSMQLTTNGTQLHRHNLANLEGINIIAVSIDSVEKETFELLRYGAKLSQVLQNVKKLRLALPHTVLQWSVVVNRLNMEQLVDIYETAAQYGIQYLSFHDIYGEPDNKVVHLLRLRESDKPLVEAQLRKIEERNVKKRIVINNVILWNGFEDGEAYDRDQIFIKLEQMKSMEPYLDYDRLDCKKADSRKIKPEMLKKAEGGEQSAGKTLALPYCVQPFEAMLIQADQNVEPCCASFGKLDKIQDVQKGNAEKNPEENPIEAVWNGKNYQMLRKAMFHWEMLPDCCRNCSSFARYDYLDEIWKRIRETGGFLERGGYAGFKFRQTMFRRIAISKTDSLRS